MTASDVRDASGAGPAGGGSAGTPASGRRRARSVLTGTLRSLVPVLLALICGGLLLLALGRDPISFYVNVWQNGVAGGSWQDSATLMAPLLLVAVGLIVIFRAKIWNLGYDGQYLLGAALVAGYAPALTQTLPLGVAFVALFLLAAAAGAVWTLLPALLKARYGTNEIITTLMMSFIGVRLANMLVKGPFQDPNVNVPQTKTLELGEMLPVISGTRVHAGLILALVVAVIAYYILSRTSSGLRLDVLGASARAARHAGIRDRRLIITVFLWSGALVGLAAAVDILGLWGYVRANWNPSYGNTVIPFVFLARLNPLAVIPFIAFYAILATGGDLATQQAQLSTDFLLVTVALILLFMTVIEYIGRKRDLGASYLPPALLRAIRQPLVARRPRD